MSTMIRLVQVAVVLSLGLLFFETGTVLAEDREGCACADENGNVNRSAVCLVASEPVGSHVNDRLAEGTISRPGKPLTGRPAGIAPGFRQGNTTFVTSRLPIRAPTPAPAPSVPPKVNISVIIYPMFLPDLVPVACTNPMMTLNASSEFTVNYSATNTGLNAAGPFDIEFVLTSCPDRPFCQNPPRMNDTGAGPAWYYVRGSAPVRALGSGEVVTDAISLSVPGEAGSGPWFLWMVIDRKNSVTESKKDNNMQVLMKINIIREPRCHKECPRERYAGSPFEEPCRTVCS